MQSWPPRCRTGWRQLPQGLAGRHQQPVAVAAQATPDADQRGGDASSSAAQNACNRKDPAYGGHRQREWPRLRVGGIGGLATRWPQDTRILRRRREMNAVSSCALCQAVNEKTMKRPLFLGGGRKRQPCRVFASRFNLKGNRLHPRSPVRPEGARWFARGRRACVGVWMVLKKERSP